LNGKYEKPGLLCTWSVQHLVVHFFMAEHTALPADHSVELSFDCHVDLPFFLWWIEDEAYLYSYPTNFETQPVKILGFRCCYHRLVE
jgi:hypothetical protein